MFGWCLVFLCFVCWFLSVDVLCSRMVYYFDVYVTTNLGVFWCSSLRCLFGVLHVVVFFLCVCVCVVLLLVWV